jgi:hypothetical protein
MRSTHHGHGSCRCDSSLIICHNRIQVPVLQEYSTCTPYKLLGVCLPWYLYRSTRSTKYWSILQLYWESWYLTHAKFRTRASVRDPHSSSDLRRFWVSLEASEVSQKRQFSSRSKRFRYVGSISNSTHEIFRVRTCGDGK